MRNGSAPRASLRSWRVKFRPGPRGDRPRSASRLAPLGEAVTTLASARRGPPFPSRRACARRAATCYARRPPRSSIARRVDGRLTLVTGDTCDCDAPASTVRASGACGAGGASATSRSTAAQSSTRTMERIRALVIPPAWSEVWICPFPNGHVQAVGVDQAGRRQYRYHAAWTKRREEEKFARMVEFARALPELREKVLADLALPGLPKERVLALGTRLLDVGMFRIGGEEYAAEHEAYGIATIEKRHLRIRGGVAHFDYPAKGGKRRQITISDPVIADLLGELKARRGGGPALLVWRDGRQWIDVTSDDLNAYLKAQSGGEFTAKDFRTWDATLLAAALCARADEHLAVGAERRSPTSCVRWPTPSVTPRPSAGSPTSTPGCSSTSSAARRSSLRWRLATKRSTSRATVTLPSSRPPSWRSSRRNRPSRPRRRRGPDDRPWTHGPDSRRAESGVWGFGATCWSLETTCSEAILADLKAGVGPQWGGNSRQSRRVPASRITSSLDVTERPSALRTDARRYRQLSCEERGDHGARPLGPTGVAARRLSDLQFSRNGGRFPARR